MTDDERKIFLKKIKEHKKKMSSDKGEAKKFLIAVGITTKKGNLTKPYRNLCIPTGQG